MQLVFFNFSKNLYSAILRLYLAILRGGGGGGDELWDEKLLL